VIGRLFDRGVVLQMGTREIRANSTHGLRSDLTGHAAVSAARLTELGRLPDGELTAHAAGLATLTASLNDELSQLNCDPAKVLAHMHGTNAPLDATWASAIAQVNTWPSGRSEYQRALLDALVEYLACERDCVRTLIENRRRPSLDQVRVPASENAAGLHQRLIFDVAQDDNAAAKALEFNRLIKGEPLEIPLSAGQCIQLIMAHHHFALICGSPWRLVDEFGEDMRLTPERCVAGRSNECDLVVDDGFRAISRRHVVFETRGQELLQITDISSLGTFVPRAWLDNRLH
jgi:hypothetical protein